MLDPLTNEQRSEITETFGRALDHGVSTSPKTRQEFAWMVLCHLVGGLVAQNVLWPYEMAQFNAISDHYGKISCGKEVI